MNASTDQINGGILMDKDIKPSESQASPPEGDQGRTYKKPVDWKEDTIIINGQPLIVLFPEDK